ncbi:MAG: Uma2 family endonuclease [Acidobacteriota bacterium]
MDLAMDRTYYTYRDYEHFPGNLRCEIIDGAIFDMTPASSTKHQMTALRIGHLLMAHLESSGHGCRPFIAPTDVVMADDQVVQPDVFVVCDGGKIRERGVFGAPDVVFEVLSPATEVKDRREKMALYARFGVTEYFLVQPDQEFIEKYRFNDGANMRVGLYRGDDVFSVDTIGLEIVAKELFTRL